MRRIPPANQADVRWGCWGCQGWPGRRSDRDGKTWVARSVVVLWVSGRPWCYVEAQLLNQSPGAANWAYCSAVTDYDAIRGEVAGLFTDKVRDVRSYVARLQKAQRAAEQELDRCLSSWVVALFHDRCVDVSGAPPPALTYVASHVGLLWSRNK
jgi:hypothetical protein